MKTIKYSGLITYVAVLVTLFTSCNKFLDILPSTSSVNPTTIKDFEEMLNMDSLALPQFFLLDLVSDDIQMRDYQLNNTAHHMTKAYLWQANIWNTADVDLMYNNAYSRILQMNVILNRVDEAPADASNTAERKSNVISQTLINRAWYYLQLVNAYGVAYDAATASTDLGVPLITKPDADDLPGRSSIQEVYNQIIADLKKAVANTYLEPRGKDIIHPGRAAGYALLARTYLLQGDYDNAEKNADTVLSMYNTIQNYNDNYPVHSQLESLSENPEVLMGRLTIEKDYYLAMGGAFQNDKSLNDSLGSYDLRNTKRFTYRSYKTTAFGTSTYLVFDNSVSTPEIYLIKAECLARAGKVSEAGNIVDLIRENRIPAANIGTRVYNADNILRFVLGERRRELFYRGGLRLFDLKRLNKEAQFKVDLTRQNENMNQTLATLEAGSARYVMPFAPIIINNNSNIIQNNR